MSSWAAQQVGLSFIKVFAWFFDVLTFPFYFILHMPWMLGKKPSAVKAEQLDPSDPYSPYVRANRETQEDSPFEHVVTIDELFRKAVADHMEKKCFGVREVLATEVQFQSHSTNKHTKCYKLGDYKWISYTEASERVENVSQGFQYLGVAPKSPVVILAETRLEWMLAAQALFRIGAYVVTVYANLGEEGMIHGINESEASILVTSEDLLPRIKVILPFTTKVKTVIYMRAKGETRQSENRSTSRNDEEVQFMTFEEMESKGELYEDTKDEVTPPRSDDIAVIMYTSGSTGVPKGVMITHENLVTMVGGLVTSVSAEVFKNAVYLAFLPLAHMMELSAECYLLANGVRIGYSSPATLMDKSPGISKGSLGDATVLQPTIFATVPLILDRFRKSVLDAVEEVGPFTKTVLEFAMNYKKGWTRKGYRTPILDKLIFRKIRRLLGGRIRLIVCGGAPLSPDTHEFTKLCLANTVIVGYGLTETSAGATVMDEDDESIGRVGAPLPGCYIRLIDWEEGGYSPKDKPNPRGEIVIGGDCVTPGYFKNEALTEQCFEECDGIRWFYSGDIGEIYPNGTLRIIDRKKDILKLSCGEYVSLSKIESQLKNCPYVDNICIYGNGFENFVVALAVPNRRKLERLANELQLPKNTTFEELCSNKKVLEAVNLALKEQGRQCGLTRTELPVKTKLCTEDWTPDSGLVTAALKLRRHVIHKFYQEFIKEMMGQAAGDATSNGVLNSIVNSSLRKKRLQAAFSGDVESKRSQTVQSATSEDVKSNDSEIDASATSQDLQPDVSEAKGSENVTAASERFKSDDVNESKSSETATSLDSATSST